MCTELLDVEKDFLKAQGKEVLRQETNQQNAREFVFVTHIRLYVVSNVLLLKILKYLTFDHSF